MHSLEMAIAGWDEKQAAYITSVYTKFAGGPGLVDELLRICSKTPSLERGSTWLIKHHLDEGQKITEGQLHKLVSLLPALNHWEARLHALQILSSIPEIPDDISEAVYAFADINSGHEKNFVRAWAFETMYKASLTNEGYRKKVLEKSRLAVETEMASVRSKLKKIITGLEKKLK